MIDFLIACAIALPIGFALGCCYTHYKHQTSELEYNINQIKEDIVSLNVKFENLLSSAED
jgi:hypothetical protein